MGRFSRCGQAGLHISLNLYMYAPVMTTAALGKLGRVILDNRRTVWLRDLGRSFGSSLYGEKRGSIFLDLVFDKLKSEM